MLFGGAGIMGLIGIWLFWSMVDKKIERIKRDSWSPPEVSETNNDRAMRLQREHEELER